MKALETLVIAGGLAFSTPAVAQENEGLGSTAEATVAAYVVIHWNYVLKNCWRVNGRR